ncbi:Transcriptional regulatory protein sin3 [Linnemannia gamsii]|uniref:Transcriptional regulatory protein sin3 n=1 Tax=Linnemannia gamsii TaxID=64522 RepID=A0ABQ7JIT9_9FUNG|nr:Transcriptional regulatory protein sin3 [Linnemannia gamsii]
MMDATTPTITTVGASSVSASTFHFQQPESRMAVAELLVSLGQSSRSVEHFQNGHQPASTELGAGSSQQTLSYRAAADYVGLVKKAYESNPKVYTEFLSALEKYHELSLTIEQLVRTVMALFQDQPDLLMGFKEFLPEAQGLLNQLVPPMMYSDYKMKAVIAQTQATIPAGLPSTTVDVEQTNQQQSMDVDANNNGHAAADFLSLIKERSQQEPDMYQHLITLLRKFQKDHSYSTLYFYVSIILRYHPHLPAVVSGIEVTEPRVISKAPPEELVISPDFIEAKDFVQTVKYEAKNDMSMYDRFIFALEKYQCTGWTIDQVYSEVSLIFWNHPEALAGFKQFITTVPQQP